MECNQLTHSWTTINKLVCLLLCSFHTNASVPECLNFDTSLKSVNSEKNKWHLKLHVKPEILFLLSDNKRVKSGSYVTVSKLYKWKDQWKIMNIVEMPCTSSTKFIVRGCYFYYCSPHLESCEWYNVVQRNAVWSLAQVGASLNLAQWTLKWQSMCWSELKVQEGIYKMYVDKYQGKFEAMIVLKIM